MGLPPYRCSSVTLPQERMRRAARVDGRVPPLDSLRIVQHQRSILRNEDLALADPPDQPCMSDGRSRPRRRSQLHDFDGGKIGDRSPDAHEFSGVVLPVGRESDLAVRPRCRHERVGQERVTGRASASDA